MIRCGPSAKRRWRQKGIAGSDPENRHLGVDLCRPFALAVNNLAKLRGDPVVTPKLLDAGLL